MSNRIASLATPAALFCRSAAVALIAGIAHRIGFDEVEARLAARPAQEQALLVGATLVALFLAALLAAQAGWIGMLLFWLAVIVLAR